MSGCLALADQLAPPGKRPAAPFGYLVFTAGQWPDRASPRTADGLDKVRARSLVARSGLSSAPSA